MKTLCKNNEYGRYNEYGNFNMYNEYNENQSQCSILWDEIEDLSWKLNDIETELVEFVKFTDSSSSL